MVREIRERWIERERGGDRKRGREKRERGMEGDGKKRERKRDTWR